jgi:translation initiation factor 1
MAKKKKRGGGLVYSTDPDFSFEEENESEETLEAGDQNLLIRLDRKQRRGKEVTLVERFVGHPDDLNDLARELKSHCGVGGSAKDGIILVQGDQRAKLFQYLTKKGYGVKKGN